MKKILEVLEYSDTEIRFNTDLDFTKQPQSVLDLVPKMMMAMSATLFGKTEINVFAVIRALAVSDLALSNNREELLVNLDLTSEAHGVAFRETIDIMVNAGKAVKIAPGASASPNLS